jgi:hypothetical protein
VIAPNCANGVCNSPCAPGYADCNGDKLLDGCEVNTNAGDPANCGGCGLVCSQNNVTPGCVNGSCSGTCAAGWGNCNNDLRTDGCETNTSTDVNNCGGCSMACSTQNIAPACTGGQCTGACNTGWADCDGNKRGNGCETNTNTDINNCGGCNLVCSNQNVSQSCGAGQCNGTCTAGWGDCNNNKQTDGCETALNTVANCGACGVACGAGQSCVSGQCLYCHDIGIVGCPTGITTVCDVVPIDPLSATQALAFCDACYGAGYCVFDNSDCSGPSYIPNDLVFCPVFTVPRWTYTNGCAGAGTVVDYCDPTLVEGKWAG